ncbi:hypothetical protein Poly51_25060 [Rubripirellula tenax]|uniref:Uncharacterized protein n=1 Tax=Rubripirellula tenax TaxID=2528015 RepID=A0A5C6F7P1_9BACT|nr:hypothetical protein Poly51_25060 [Rubripirellula tenax]
MAYDSTPHRSLLNTSAIENSFLNARRKLGRVKLFLAETGQASRWLSYVLLKFEKGFRQISVRSSQSVLMAALVGPQANPA